MTRPVAMSPLQIAQIAHEANRAYRVEIGEDPGPSWAEAEEDLRQGVVHGVKVAQEGNGPEEMHRQWLMVKEVQGWTYGKEKDPIAKTHPQMVPYADLPFDQKRKDSLFIAVVTALTGGSDPESLTN